MNTYHSEIGLTLCGIGLW